MLRDSKGIAKAELGNRFAREIFANLQGHWRPYTGKNGTRAYVIDEDKCIGCTKCAKACPVSAISGEKKAPHRVDQSLCVKCDSCYMACPSKVQAVTKVRAKDVAGGLTLVQEAS